MVLDSNHSRAHVLRELRLWERLVRSHYVIVEDTNMNLRLAVTARGPHPGAFEAVQGSSPSRIASRWTLPAKFCDLEPLRLPCAAWLIPPVVILT